MPEYNDPQQNTLRPDNAPKKKAKTEVVKDAISKGKTATGKKPDQIEFNPVLEVKVDDVFSNFVLKTAVNEIGAIYDQVVSEAYDEDKENAKIKKLNHANTHFRDDATSTRTMLYKQDTPGEPKSSKIKEDVNLAFEAWVDDENPDPKHREVVNRHGQNRKKIQLVPRDKKDRKEDDRPYRQQSTVKKVIDEKYGKGYKSPWQKIMAAAPKGTEERINKAVEGLKQNAADYQKILDKEKKKTNESVNTAGSGGVRGFGNVTGNPDGSDIGSSYVNANIADADTKDNLLKAQVKAHVSMHTVTNSDKKVAKEEKEVWNKPAPKGKHGHMTPAQKARAKARAKAAGRPYPNLVDNMAVMKEENDPLAHLEDKLNKATDTSHNGIDKIMRTVASDHSMDVNDLHDQWVKKYKITPDQYCKEENINEISSDLLHRASDIAQRQSTVHRSKANDLIRKSYQYHDGNKVIQGKEKQHDDLIKQSETEREKQQKRQAQADKFFKVGNVRKRKETNKVKTQ
jgi:hypothetical protein